MTTDPSPTSTARLAQLLEERDIVRLMTQYADRIDANDPIGSAACFAPDGVGFYWGEFVGREAIAARLAGILDQFWCTSHHLTNWLIELNGDRATAQSYVYAFHRRRSDGLPYWVSARWVDQLVRTPEEGWRFARREVATVGSVLAQDIDANLNHPNHPGRLDRPLGVWPLA
jgi:hypothetical protein